MGERFDKGIKAEEASALFLERQGYECIATRYKGNGGEIDIIAVKDNVLVLVEVRFRKTIMTAAESITPLKMERLRKAADYFLMQNPTIFEKHPFIRFDVVLLSKDGKIVHIENAFGGSQ